MKTHGFSKTKFYRRWKGMRERCCNPKHKSFRHYGGRGIKVCPEWHVFENFHRDMFPSFLSNLRLDRIENDGDYSPANCRWSTQRENCNNRRDSVLLEHGGVTMTATQWSRKLGILADTIKHRARRGADWTDARNFRHAGALKRPAA